MPVWSNNVDIKAAPFRRSLLDNVLEKKMLTWKSSNQMAAFKAGWLFWKILAFSDIKKCKMPRVFDEEQR